MMLTQTRPVPTRCDSLLAQGLSAFNQGDLEPAIQLFRRAAGSDLKRSEPWYWLGRVQEERGDRPSAGYCYELAMTLGHGYGPAREAMARLGYLGDPDRR